MTPIEKQILENQVAIMQQINHLYFRGNIIKSLNLLYPKEQSKEEPCCEMPKRSEVYIERAAPLTKEGIKAICGTDEEYEKFVKQKTGEQDE